MLADTWKLREIRKKIKKGRQRGRKTYTAELSGNHEMDNGISKKTVAEYEK
jgi:hypothetical protein